MRLAVELLKGGNQNKWDTLMERENSLFPFDDIAIIFSGAMGFKNALQLLTLTLPVNYKKEEHQMNNT